MTRREQAVQRANPGLLKLDPHIQSLVDHLHPKQKLVYESPARQILFGGAAGPGKSHLLRVAAIAWAAQIPKLQVYLFRRKFPDLYKNHMQGPTSFPELLAPLVAQKKVRIVYSPNHEILFPNGSRISLQHMQHEKDRDNIHGAEIHVALVDELTHFTKTMFTYIRSRVRMTGVKLPDRFGKPGELFPRIVCATNPGSVGHTWVKALFIDSAPPGVIWEATKKDGGLTTQFIPALLQDNPTLSEEDPDYLSRLEGLGQDALVKAMAEGNWNIVAGGAIDDVWDEEKHAINPFAIPRSWPIYRSFDWGSSKPFSVGWWTISDGNMAPNGVAYPKGTRFRIAEWYGWNGEANEGCKMLAVDVARGILQKEYEMGYQGRIKGGVADIAIFKAENGVCIADDMGRIGVRWMPSDSSPGSRMNGLEAVRRRLKAGTVWPMEEPGMFIFNTCRHWIRTVPVLPRDQSRPEDVDSESEDHAYDETRYHLMTPPGPVGGYVKTFGY